ncbi:winged helix-turn-helix transcriptional regulator [Cetobacterium sp. SF1]|uniref:winged helix-turn-helix transcriptional regulator n=1 Tax=Cetobacterium sp. SF1 TaxID=3417654 RepID=UPI003CF3D442
MEYRFFRVLKKKWSVPIILQLKENETMRISELRKIFPDSTDKMLIETLNILIKYKIVKKKDYEVYPKHTEYSLTSYGKGIYIILKDIEEFCDKYENFLAVGE